MKHLFRILAVPDPQALPRVLGVLAQRSLMPDRLSARHVDGRLRIALALDLDSATARIVAAKLLEAFLVVEVVCRAMPARADRGIAGRTPPPVISASSDSRRPPCA